MEAIETPDPAPTNLTDDLSAAWDGMEEAAKEVETPTEDVQEVPEVVAEEEAPDDVTEEPEASDDDPEETPDEEVEGLVAPEHWSKEDREMFDGLDEGAREFVNRRYLSMEKDYTAKTQKAASATKYSDQIKEMLNPFRERMQLAGVDDISAIGKLVAAQALLDRDPKAGIEHLAKAYGVDLDEVDVVLDEVDPQIKQLQEQITQLQGGQQTSAMDVMVAKLEGFKNETDTKGTLLHPHYDEVYDDMVTLVKSKVASDIATAYQKAIWANETVRGKMLKDVEENNTRARTAANAEKTSKAKRTAKTNRKGSGDPQADTGKELTLQQELEKNYDAA